MSGSYFFILTGIRQCWFSFWSVNNSENGCSPYCHWPVLKVSLWHIFLMHTPSFDPYEKSKRNKGYSLSLFVVPHRHWTVASGSGWFESDPTTPAHFRNEYERTERENTWHSDWKLTALTPSPKCVLTFKIMDFFFPRFFFVGGKRKSL